MIFRFGIVCLALSLGTDAFSVGVDYPQVSKFDVSEDILGYSEDANLNAVSNTRTIFQPFPIKKLIF